MGFTVATSWKVSRASRLRLRILMPMLVTGCTTAILQLALLPPTERRTTALPRPTAFTVPVSETVTTFSSLLRQARASVKFWGVTVITRSAVLPFKRVSSVSLRLTLSVGTDLSTNLMLLALAYSSA